MMQSVNISEEAIPPMPMSDWGWYTDPSGNEIGEYLIIPEDKILEPSETDDQEYPIEPKPNMEPEKIIDDEGYLSIIKDVTSTCIAKISTYISEFGN